MISRESALARLSGETWDLVVIGGGATGLGTAVDAASRGYSTLLLEQSDFAKATSSRSTKLIHGGVRYLQQGNVSLVRESLHERGLLLRNAAAFVRPLEFIIPAHSLFEKFYYAAGLKAYDLLAGKLGMAGSSMLSMAETLRRIPTLQTGRFSGGVSYFDAQFDDSRFAVALACSLMEQGGIALNYMRVASLRKEQGRIAGLEAIDGETGDSYRISARSVVNAGGIFSDEVRSLDDPKAAPSLSLSQGSHIVVDRKFLPGSSAIIVPSTDDGRVLFLIPWHGSTVIGTTDIPVENAELEPRPLRQEIEFLLEHSNRYLSEKVTHADILSCFSGLRPLVKSSHAKATSQLSRDHVVHTSGSGLVSITGGKWTTFRKMGADAVDHAVRAGGLVSRPSKTEALQFSKGDTEAANDLHRLPEITDDFVRHCVRETLARTVEDVLARRSRLLFVNAHQALKHAPHVANIVAEELHQDQHWAATQLAEFQQTAANYLPV